MPRKLIAYKDQALVQKNGRVTTTRSHKDTQFEKTANRRCGQKGTRYNDENITYTQERKQSTTL